MVRAIRWPKIDTRLTPTPGRTSIGSLGMIMRLQHFGCKNRPLFHIQVTKVNYILNLFFSQDECYVQQKKVFFINQVDYSLKIIGPIEPMPGPWDHSNIWDIILANFRPSPPCQIWRLWSVSPLPHPQSVTLFEQPLCPRLQYTSFTSKSQR